jgi:hypothetical protein
MTANLPLPPDIDPDQYAAGLRAFTGVETSARDIVINVIRAVRPYTATQEAYERACAALAEHRARADAAEALLAQMRDHLGRERGEIDLRAVRELLAGREVDL